jgi:hypothetical protein
MSPLASLPPSWGDASVPPRTITRPNGTQGDDVLVLCDTAAYRTRCSRSAACQFSDFGGKKYKRRYSTAPPQFSRMTCETVPLAMTVLPAAALRPATSETANRGIGPGSAVPGLSIRSPNHRRGCRSPMRPSGVCGAFRTRAAADSTRSSPYLATTSR